MFHLTAGIDLDLVSSKMTRMGEESLLCAFKLFMKTALQIFSLYMFHKIAFIDLDLVSSNKVTGCGLGGGEVKVRESLLCAFKLLTKSSIANP